ncbi:MFS transporter [Plantactinospora sp. WMMB334]|uniref:MFS transporter n=1 Tax=Plantactinospora sp. WMMB334 TaxID=3404119 RepID=UPI003B9310DE
MIAGRARTDLGLLWIANTAGQFGTRIGSVALPMLAISVLAASPWELGLLAAVQSAGILLVGLPVGAFVDRIRRRRLMVGADIARALLLAGAAIGAWTGLLNLAALFAVVLGVGIATACAELAQQAFLPRLVGTGHVVEANSRLQTSNAAAAATGPGLAGGLVGLLGAAGAMLVTATTFVASLAALLRMRHREPPAPATPRRHLLAEIGEGMRLVLTDPILRAIALCTSSANLFMAAAASQLVIFLVRVVGLSPFVVGILLAASGVGGVLGAATARRWVALLGQPRAIWLSLLVTQPFALLLPLSGRDGARLLLFLLGWLVVGYGGALYNVLQVSYRQATCPDRLLGRVQACNRFLAWGTLPLGGLLGGTLGGWLGPRGALLVAAAGLVASTSWLTLSPLPRTAADRSGGSRATHRAGDASPAGPATGAHRARNQTSKM